MTEHQVVPDYGAKIAVEDSTSTFYLREKALDAVHEQVVEDLNDALEQLNGRGILVGTDYEAIRGLRDELQQAASIADTAFEIALAKQFDPEAGERD